MIVEQNRSEVVTIGDVQKNQVSIDSKNINHIVTILSSNLYSHPKESFLRETISNAVDAHVESGSKEPIILTLQDKFLAIRDFGTGISPERFKDIYLNIGSSTKRESNEYIGHFGIGRFSALSCSNLVNITSYYNGKAYYYLMMKDLDKLSIDLINEADTEEANGVEVKIPIKETEVEKYIEILYTLSFIPNIYLNAPNETIEAQRFNNRKIYNYNTFKCCNYKDTNSNCKVLIGNILYVIDTSKFSKFYSGDYREAFKHCYPIFNIGDLDITPNRESILYSDRTVQRINDRLQEVENEFKEMLNKEYNKDYDDLIEYAYFEYYNVRRELKLGDETITFYSEVKGVHGTYKGSTLDREDPIIGEFLHLMSYESIHIIAIKSGREIRRGKRIDDNLYRLLNPDRWHNTWDKETQRTFLVVPTARGFSSKYLNEYLVQEYPEDLIILEDPFKDRDIKSYIRSKYYSMSMDEKELKVALHLFWEMRKSIKKYCLFEDVMNSPSYQEFKREAKLLNVTTQVFEKETVFYIYNPEYNNEYIHSKKFKSTKELTKYMSTNFNNKIWAYGINTDEEFQILPKLHREDIIGIAVAKTNKRILENLPKRYIPVSDIVNKDNKTIRTIATAISIAGFKWVDTFFENESKLNSMASLLPKEEGDKIRYFIKEYHIPYGVRDYELMRINESQVDEDLIIGYEACCKYWDIILTMSSLLAYTNINTLFAYIGMKKKLFRVSYQTYKKIKQLLNFEQ